MVSSAIIGAGIAGIHMANKLKKEAKHQVVIFEASNRLGGKLYTIKGSVRKEMGACWLSPTYKYTLALIEKYRIKTPKGAGLDREMVLKDGTHTNLSHTLGNPVSFLFALYKYSQLFHKLFATEDFVFPPPLPIYRKTIKQWLEENQLQVLIPFLRIVQTAQGYGQIEVKSCFYLFYWAKPSVMNSFVWAKLRLGKPIPLLLPHGYHQLATKMASRLDIRYETPITHIKKQGSQWLVHGELFDYVFFAMDVTKDMYAPSHKLFQHFQRDILRTTLARICIPWQRTYPVITFDKGLDHLGSLYTIRDEAFAVTDKVKQKQNTLVVTYQLATSEMTHLQKTLEKEYKEYNITLKETLYQCRWKYFPHLTPKYSFRIYQTIWNTQGKDNIFYIGARPSFESVEHILHYNQVLYEKHFTS